MTNQQKAFYDEWNAKDVEVHVTFMSTMFNGILCEFKLQDIIKGFWHRMLDESSALCYTTF